MYEQPLQFRRNYFSISVELKSKSAEIDIQNRQNCIFSRLFIQNISYQIALPHGIERSI